MNLPETIGGYQHLAPDVMIEAGDIYVDHGEVIGFVRDTIGRLVGEIERQNAMNIYRKIPVAKQGDSHRMSGAGVEALAEECAKFEERAKAATYDDGKPPLASLPPAALIAVARVQAYGKKKYGDDENYRKGMESKRQMSCVLRHVFAYLDGEDNDPESGEPHLAHATTRLMFAIQNIKDGVMVDDRFKRP